MHMFHGEKNSQRSDLEGHLATEIAQAQISRRAVRYEAKYDKARIAVEGSGYPCRLEMRSDALVAVRCGNDDAERWKDCKASRAERVRERRST